MDEREQQLLNDVLAFLERQPEARVTLRLILSYGARHRRGTVLLLDWGRVADSLARLLEIRLQHQPTCSLLLSGGKTPEALYLLLGARYYQNALDWTRVHLFWGDERYVPHDDPRSNYHLAHEAWLRKANIPRENIHPMPTHYPNPDEAARAYEAELRAYFGAEAAFPHFDLALLGLGDDGHIASLFAGDPALDETTRWVVPSCAPVEPRQRLTLTLPVLNAAPRVWLLVSGESKRPVLEQLFREDAPDLPAARLTPSVTRFWWLSDDLYTAVRPYLETQ
ncbi:MAG: 6-phosphogluconolactonase [Fimbriimonadales bacterium]|nr:6-phosphogluconolactonase [Fimbriimonadales bacterium]